VRIAFFVLGLVVLGATYAASGSEALQVLALFVLTLGVFPAIRRRTRSEADQPEAVRERNPPLSVTALSLGFALAWGALVFAAAPDLGVGPWFWWWVVMWLWAEVNASLVGHRFRRDGGENWKRVRPIHDAALWGAVTAGVLVIIFLLEGSSAAEALLTGALCGFIVFAMTAAVTRRVLRRRDPPGQHTPPRSEHARLTRRN
jgi:hypothetical protein